MYLSTGGGTGPESVADTRHITAAAGSLTRILVPAAQVWRTHDRRRASAVSSKAPRIATAHVSPRSFVNGRQAPHPPLPASLQTFLFWGTPFRYLQYCRHRYGPTFTLNATSHPPLVFLSGPLEIRSLMAAPEETLRAGEGGASVSPIVGGRSFMLADGPEHNIGRKTTLAAFHLHAIKRHTDTIADAAERAVLKWPTDTPVALHPRLRSLTLEVILRTLTGRFTGNLDDLTRSLHDQVLEMLKVTASPVLVEPHMRHGPGRRTWQRFLRNRARVDELLAELINERTPARRSPEDLLSELASLRNADDSRQSLTQVRDNAMSLILAGHETTAAQLAWAFQLLAHHPTVRDRLHKEIDAGVSEEYLTATIQEVLRHRCVFLFAIPRAVAKPIEIGVRIHSPPAHLLACIYLLHHDPNIYPDPHAFRPERFLDSPPDPRTWMPWGGGRKRCPGLHLAMLEMKTVLRTVLAERTVDPASRHMERPRWRSVIVTPHAGSRVILRARR
ncbi:MAG TPA: cytochrome P450 [Gemmatimonadaceae bacterium]